MSVTVGRLQENAAGKLIDAPSGKAIEAVTGSEPCGCGNSAAVTCDKCAASVPQCVLLELSGITAVAEATGQILEWGGTEANIDRDIPVRKESGQCSWDYTLRAGGNLCIRRNDQQLGSKWVLGFNARMHLWEDSGTYHRMVRVMKGDVLLFVGHDTSATPFDCTGTAVLNNELAGTGEIETFNYPIAPGFTAFSGYSGASGGTVTVNFGGCGCIPCCPTECGNLHLVLRNAAFPESTPIFDGLLHDDAGRCTAWGVDRIDRTIIGDHFDTPNFDNVFATLVMEMIEGICHWVIRVAKLRIRFDNPEIGPGGSFDAIQADEICCEYVLIQPAAGCPLPGIENWTITQNGSDPEDCPGSVIGEVEVELPEEDEVDPPSTDGCQGGCANCDLGYTFGLVNSDAPLNVVPYCLYQHAPCSWVGSGEVVLDVDSYPLPAPSTTFFPPFFWHGLMKCVRTEDGWKFRFTLSLLRVIGFVDVHWWEGIWESDSSGTDCPSEDPADWDLVSETQSGGDFGKISISTINADDVPCPAPVDSTPCAAGCPDCFTPSTEDPCIEPAAQFLILTVSGTPGGGNDFTDSDAPSTSYASPTCEWEGSYTGAAEYNWSILCETSGPYEGRLRLEFRFGAFPGTLVQAHWPLGVRCPEDGTPVVTSSEAMGWDSVVFDFSVGTATTPC